MFRIKDGVRIKGEGSNKVRAITKAISMLSASGEVPKEGHRKEDGVEAEVEDEAGVWPL